MERQFFSLLTLQNEHCYAFYAFFFFFFFQFLLRHWFTRKPRGWYANNSRYCLLFDISVRHLYCQLRLQNESAYEDSRFIFWLFS